MQLPLLIISALFLASACRGDSETIQLPSPSRDDDMTLVEALETRRSVRTYSTEPLTLAELSSLLHSAQGITSENGFRTAPSAGATYPYTLYAVVENVADMQPGIYTYDQEDNTLIPVRPGSHLDALASASLGQSCISTAAMAIVMVADYSITTRVYGERGVMYVHMEAGHISQNLYLRAASLGLGTVAVGAFNDSGVNELLQLDEELRSVYIMPFGRI